MKNKTNPLYSKVSRKALARHASDLILSSVLALFLCGLIHELFDLDNIIAAIGHKSPANLMAVIADFELGRLRIKPINSTILHLALFLLLALGILISYMLIHLKLSKSESKKNQLKAEEFQNYFTTIITENNSAPDSYLSAHSSTVRMHLSKDDLYNIDKRLILLKELRSMHSLVGGQEKIRLEDQYFALGFVDELEDKFLSPDWVVRAQAVSETAQFKVKKYYPYIEDLMSDRNESVRQNAMIAQMKLDDQPLSILDRIKRPLSVWEKHQMYLAIKALPSHKLPPFTELINKYSIHKDFINDLKLQFNV